MATTSAHALSLVGSTLGKDYLVLEPIGMGGMAVVYLVEHQTLHKRFAVKVMAAEHASSEEARARFTQEAHAASQLDHENIVTISDFGMTPDQLPFYVMELLRGQTLMDRIEEGRMTLEEVVAVSVPVARALAHAHAEGVIHRDVKPENVFLVQRSQGRWGVKVLDFGIAKVTTNPALTKMGQALGSPMFMSPEACRGDDVDQRSDLYSFGIVLYLMLTGRVPFTDESLLKVLQMQVSAPVPPLRDHVPDISPELEAVVMKTLAKDPEDRYPTMEALLFDLQQALPEGSDSLLMQAQFGTSLQDTPFPSQSLRMMAQRASSQRLMIGDTDASSHLRSPSTSARLPVAPPKRARRALLGIGIAGMLIGGGGIAWRLWDDARSAPSELPATTATALPTPAPTPLPAASPTPAAPTPAPTPVPEQPAVAAAIPDAAVVAEVVAKPAPAIATRTPIVRTPARPIVRAPAQSPRRAVALNTEPAPQVAPEPAPVIAPKPVVAEPVAPVEVPRPPPAPGSAAPIQKPKPVVVDVGSLDAVPTIANLDVNGPLPSSTVRRSIERLLPALRACYRAAATAQNKTPPVKVMLGFEIDESSAATGVTANGNFGSLSSCARGAFGRLQTQQAPDVGTVRVAVTITFRPS